MSAVAAFPDLDFGLGKHLCKFDVLEKGAVPLFVVLFDGGDETEFGGEFGEAFLFGGLSKLLVHIRPFVVLARRGGCQVFGRVADALEFLEPQLCVFLFVVCRL